MSTTSPRLSQRWAHLLSTMSPRQVILRGALTLSIVAQLVVLYDPSPSGVPVVPGLDKIVHVTVFLVPTVLGVLAVRRRPWIVPLVMTMHAPLSEVVQGVFLPERSSDLLDAIADLVGVGLGAALGAGLAVAVSRRAAARRTGRVS